MRHSPAPPREHQVTEDEALTIGELCIRFMEKTIENVLADATLKNHYNEIFPILADVTQDILQKYAFDYAYYLYSHEEVVRDKRLAFELELRGEKGRDLSPARDDS
jgi:hypothetical protein